MWFAVAAAGSVSLVAVIAWYVGAFSKVKFVNDELEPHLFYYVEFRGPYKNVSSTFAKVCDIAGPILSDKVEHTVAGLYFDNPDIVPAELCRSYIGILVKCDDRGITKAPADVLDKLEGQGLRLMKIPRTKCYKTEFPCVAGFVSIIVAIIKVYGAAKTQCPSWVGGAMELYPKNRMVFIFPTEKAPAFEHPDGPIDSGKKKN